MAAFPFDRGRGRRRARRRRGPAEPRRGGPVGRGGGRRDARHPGPPRRAGDARRRSGRRPARSRTCRTPASRTSRRRSAGCGDAGFTVVGLDERAPADDLRRAVPGRVGVAIVDRQRGHRASAGSSASGATCSWRCPMRGRVGSLNAAASLAATLYAYVLPSRAWGMMSGDGAAPGPPSEPTPEPPRRSSFEDFEIPDAAASRPPRVRCAGRRCSPTAAVVLLVAAAIEPAVRGRLRAVGGPSRRSAWSLGVAQAIGAVPGAASAIRPGTRSGSRWVGRGRRRPHPRR